VHATPERDVLGSNKINQAIEVDSIIPAAKKAEAASGSCARTSATSFRLADLNIRIIGKFITCLDLSIVHGAYPGHLDEWALSKSDLLHTRSIYCF
jgi:hypothetical protein